MIVDSQRVSIEGHLLHRMVFAPPDDVPLRAAVIFYHGQGDYAERYLDVLDVFTSRGIKCTITELPGHGLSPGRRGHCGDVELLNAVVEDMLCDIQDLPYGVMGHSMGGLLAIKHLIEAGRGNYPMPDFAWLSSPLVRPGRRRPDWYKSALRFFSKLMPGLTITTGVTPQMCRVPADDADDSPPPQKHRLWHRRVSLGWGACLLDMEKMVQNHVGEIPSTIPIIYTQGAEDPVCSPEEARRYFQLLPCSVKGYHEFEGMLHEPFRGKGNEQLFEVLSKWLEELPLK